MGLAWDGKAQWVELAIHPPHLGLDLSPFVSHFRYLSYAPGYAPSFDPNCGWGLNCVPYCVRHPQVPFPTYRHLS